MWSWTSARTDAWRLSCSGFSLTSSGEGSGRLSYLQQLIWRGCGSLNGWGFTIYQQETQVETVPDDDDPLWQTPHFRETQPEGETL
jgi:hypothetical protein